eukprot:3415185-Lingulodinium_polyedra.AAC.1
MFIPTLISSPTRSSRSERRRRKIPATAWWICSPLAMEAEGPTTGARNITSAAVERFTAHAQSRMAGSLSVWN